MSSERPPSPTASGGLPRSDSKPYIPILERSSQLAEDFSEEKPRVVIDATTPPIAREKQKPAEEDVVATEGEVRCVEVFEKARCVEVFDVSSEWFNCTEPSSTSSTRCVGYLYTGGSTPSNLLEPSRTTSVQRKQGV